MRRKGLQTDCLTFDSVHHHQESLDWPLTADGKYGQMGKKVTEYLSEYALSDL